MSTRLHGTRKPAVRVSPNRLQSITHDRMSLPAPTCAATAHTFILERSLWHTLCVCPTHLQLAHNVQAHALYGWWYGRPTVRQLKHTCPSCRHCPPFNGDASREALRAARTPSVEGGAAALPSVPVLVGFTLRKASSFPFTICRAISASGKSKWLRSAAIVNRRLYPAFCNMRSPSTRITRKIDIFAAKPFAFQSCPPWQDAPLKTGQSGRSYWPRPYAHCRTSIAPFPSIAPAHTTIRSVENQHNPAPPDRACNQQAAQNNGSVNGETNLSC